MYDQCKRLMQYIPWPIIRCNFPAVKFSTLTSLIIPYWNFPQWVPWSATSCPTENLIQKFHQHPYFLAPQWQTNKPTKWTKTCTSLLSVKHKGFPYSLPNAGPKANPGVQAVSPNRTTSHPPGGRLPLLSARQVTIPAAEHHRPLAGTKLYCLVTEAHRREQLAQGCYTALPRVEFEPTTCWSQVQLSTRCATALVGSVIINSKYKCQSLWHMTVCSTAQVTAGDQRLAKQLLHFLQPFTLRLWKAHSEHDYSNEGKAAV